MQQHTAEQFVDLPVPQILEEIAEATQPGPQERTAERIFEHSVDVPAPQAAGKTVEVVKAAQEPLQRHTAEQFVDVPAPQILEEIAEDAQIAEVIQLTPHDRIIDEQISDFPVPLTQARLVEVATTIPERLAQRTGGALGGSARSTEPRATRRSRGNPCSRQ